MYARLLGACYAGSTTNTPLKPEWRILAIDTDIDKELVEHRFNAVFAVAA